MLRIVETLPEGFLQLHTEQLEERLGGPTLIHLPGRRPEPLFVSILLHGNEDTGFRAMQSMLRDYQDRELPRALTLFVGNVAAARKGMRFLDGQPDYNRIWPGAETGGTAEHRMMAEIVDLMKGRGVFASIDLHNNTGLNPHYACINRIEDRFMQLATLFSRTVVYFIRPHGVQSMAFAPLCPSITVECGRVGQAHGVEHAREYIEACLHLSEIPDHPVAPHDIDLFHTVAVVKVPEQVSFRFGGSEADICFTEYLDHLNFRELPVGTTLGRTRNGQVLNLDVRDDQGREVADRYFRVDNNAICTTRPFMPSMFCLDERIVRQDCLGYLMERLLPDGTPKP